MDVITPEQRSYNMSRIKAGNTKPEIAVRKMLWNLGYRYRLHAKSLSGRPDIYLAKYKTAIFVNGCFWHQHKGCKRSFMPKSKIEYWKPKLDKNVKRLKEQVRALQEKGIKVIIIWECEVKKKEEVRSLLVNSLT